MFKWLCLSQEFLDKACGRPLTGTGPATGLSQAHIDMPLTGQQACHRPVTSLYSVSTGIFLQGKFTVNCLHCPDPCSCSSRSRWFWSLRRSPNRHGCFKGQFSRRARMRPHCACYIATTLTTARSFSKAHNSSNRKKVQGLTCIGMPSILYEAETTVCA